MPAATVLPFFVFLFPFPFSRFPSSFPFLFEGEHPKLGFPLGEGRTQKAFVIYCWNEFGEDGIVAPTKGEGAMKLECIRDVFRPAGKRR